jgi:hypothetical protein
MSTWPEGIEVDQPTSGNLIIRCTRCTARWSHPRREPTPGTVLHLLEHVRSHGPEDLEAIPEVMPEVTAEVVEPEDDEVETIQQAVARAVSVGHAVQTAADALENALGALRGLGSVAPQESARPSARRSPAQVGPKKRPPRSPGKGSK